MALTILKNYQDEDKKTSVNRKRKKAGWSDAPSLTFHDGDMGSHIQLNGLNNDYILIMINGKRMNGEDVYKRQVLYSLYLN